MNPSEKIVAGFPENVWKNALSYREWNLPESNFVGTRMPEWKLELPDGFFGFFAAVFLYIKQKRMYINRDVL